MRRFGGFDLGREPVSDETIVCKFRRVLERHESGKRMFQQVGRHLQTRRMTVSGGTIVDAIMLRLPL